MKKLILFFIIVLLFSTQAFTADFQLLRVEVPSEKNRLLFNVQDLERMVDASGLKDKYAVIKFIDMTTGSMLTELGKVREGKIKWGRGHKMANENFVSLKFKKDEYSMIVNKVEAKAKNPGFQVQIIELAFDMDSAKNKLTPTFEKKAKYIEKADTMKIIDITFAQMVDLAVDMEYPIEVTPGEEMGDRVSVRVENKGNIPAKAFNVELVLSGDTKVPVQPASPSENFTEDMLLQGARAAVESLKPGESKKLTFKGTVKIPADTSPDRYYLGAVADPENQVEEVTEDNNAAVKFIMISHPQPKRIVLDMSATQLVYDPASYGLTIMCGGVLLSDGRDWQKCRIRPYLYQIKHVGWTDFHWEFNTLERSLWKIKGEKFCKVGGVGQELKAKMEVSGGSKTSLPSKVVLNLSDTQLDYGPETGELQLLSYGAQIAYVPLWKVTRLKSHLYQMKFNVWDFFWEVDTFKKEVNKVTSGIFGREGGGTPTPVDIHVDVEN